MGNHRTWRWVIAISALSLTTGCGGQGGPQASSSRPSPTAGTMTTASSPATSSTPAIDPNIPAAARAHTPAGAEAFARYYVEQINAVGLKPRAGRLGSFGVQSCKTCENYESSATSLAARGQRYSGPIFTIQSVTAGASGEAGGTRVSVLVHQNPIHIVASDGSVVRTGKEYSASLDWDLVWIDGKWAIQEGYARISGQS